MSQRSKERFFDFCNRLGTRIFNQGVNRGGNLNSRESLDDFILSCHENGMSIAQIGLAIENDRTFCKMLGIDYSTLGEPWKATDYVSKITGNYQLDQQLFSLQQDYNQQSKEAASS